MDEGGKQPEDNNNAVDPAHSTSTEAARQSTTSATSGAKGRFQRHHTNMYPDRRGNKSQRFNQRGNRNPQKSPSKNHNSADRRQIPSDGSDQAPRANKTSSNGRKRFQHRNSKQREKKWKPYHLLSWEEKKVVEERETIRAEQRRNQLTALGYPQAPYNTTQFLMEDHKSEYDKQFDDGVLSSEESSPPEDDIALDRGYDQEFVRVLMADLSQWTKDRLINRILEQEQEKGVLERKVKNLEREVEELTPRLGDGENEEWCSNVIKEVEPTISVTSRVEDCPMEGGACTVQAESVSS